MERLFDKHHHLHALEPHLPDDVTVRHWLMIFAGYMLAMSVPLVLLISAEGWAWANWIDDTAETFSRTSVAIKLIGLTFYMSLACTFLPLPTGWIIAGVATQQAAVAGDAWQTAMLVGLCGAIGSTMANLNDYHIFTWMLRHQRISAVRTTRSYKAAEKWFARSPFFLVLVSNIIPIPVDFVRMLATSYRYPRLPFAAANLIGRFLRYGIIAFVTFYWNLGWIAPVALLALAAVLGAWRFAPGLFRKLFLRSANQTEPSVSNTVENTEEQQL